MVIIQLKLMGILVQQVKKHLKEFQSSNNLVSDGILGKNTCKKLNNKANVVKKK